MSLLTNRRRGVGKSLPYDAEIEYLEDDGASFVRITLPFKNTWSWFVDFMRLHNSTTYTAIVTSYPYKVAFFTRSEGAVWTNGNENRINIIVPQNLRVQVEANQTQINYSWGGRNTMSAPSAYQLTYFFLFSTSTTAFHQHRLYGAKIKDNDNKLVMDLIPVRKGNVGYMYDKISGQLFGNNGTGNFILGADK